MNESTVLGYVHGEEVKGHFMRSVCDLMDADYERGPSRRRIHSRIDVESGPRIAEARNQIVRTFLKSDASWLLMLDDDMVFPPQTFDRLMAAAHPRDYPIVGGLCFGGGRSGVMFPTLYVLQQPSEEDPHPIRRIDEYPENVRVKVDATGAAFLLVHRRVYEEMAQQFEEPYPWFVEGSVYAGIPFSEDMAFCMRAGVMGIPVHVHTGAKVGHIKTQVLDEDLYERYLKTKAELGEDGIEAAFKKRLGERA